MHEVLVVDTKFFLFVLLLILQNEVVEENFVQSIDVFLYQQFDSLNGGFLVLIQTDFLSIKVLYNVPELFKSVTA